MFEGFGAHHQRVGLRENQRNAFQPSDELLSTGISRYDFKELVLIPAMIFDLIAEDEQARVGGPHLSIGDARAVAVQTEALGSTLHPEDEEDERDDARLTPLTPDELVRWWNDEEEGVLRNADPTGGDIG